MSGKENGELAKWPARIDRKRDKVRKIDQKIKKTTDKLRDLQEKKAAAVADLRETEKKAEEARLRLVEKIQALRAEGQLSFGTPLVEGEKSQESDT